jgi:hypothetical protein
MSDKKLTEELNKLIPQCLDDIIRMSRDKCRLALATEGKMAELGSSVPDVPVQDSLTHWQTLAIHITQEDGAQVAPPYL